MKKLVLSLAVVFAVGMVSCGDNKKAEGADTCTDTCNKECVDTAAQAAETTTTVDSTEVVTETTEAPADSAAA